MGKRKTHEEYVDELAIKNPNIEVIGQYINTNIPILHKCLIHGTEWMAQPTNVLYGKKCPDCANEGRRKNNSMSHEEYVRQLSIKNPTIEVIEKYINAKTKILHHCLIHDFYWEITPTSVLSKKSGCPKCKKEKFAKSTTKTKEEYVAELLTKNPNIELIGNYLGNKVHTRHYCKLHNYSFDSTPDVILRGCGCKFCGTEKIADKKRKTHEQYLTELKEINPDIIALETYDGALIPILHKCLIDGHEWHARPANILFGNGCPQCHESSGERKVRQWLEKHNIPYIFQQPFKDCRDIKPLPFDFYLPTYNSCIEYDDRQHFEPIEYFGGQDAFEITIKHDNMKNEYCKDNGISLLRIPYFKNIEEELNNFLFI